MRYKLCQIIEPKKYKCPTENISTAKITPAEITQPRNDDKDYADTLFDRYLRYICLHLVSTLQQRLTHLRET